MRTREEFESLEKTVLAPYASHSGASIGREYSEPEHPYRTRFQRDRDRIIHSKAFRRLEYKTQVFVNHEGDHYRTRLTHTLETAQISRTIARILKLNEDLAEAIALSHDLGHPPFGHSGQDVINQLMQEHGGFEHNRQSLRVVAVLEQPYSSFPGLNLSYEVLHGISKHFREYSVAPKRRITREGAPSLEAQVVNLADEIAYNNHDLDDGLRSQLITLDQLKQLPIWQEIYESMPKDEGESFRIHETIKSLINSLVLDLVEQTNQNLISQKIESRSDVSERGEKLAGFSSSVQKKVIELKKFLFSNLYRHYRVERMAEKGNRILKDLFQIYTQNPKILPTEIYLKTKEEDSYRVICDYIAGMTDRFALDEHSKLFDPHARV